jgi:hypothetical protein
LVDNIFISNNKEKPINQPTNKRQKKEGFEN